MRGRDSKSKQNTWDKPPHTLLHLKQSTFDNVSKKRVLKHATQQQQKARYKPCPELFLCQLQTFILYWLILLLITSERSPQVDILSESATTRFSRACLSRHCLIFKDVYHDTLYIKLAFLGQQLWSCNLIVSYRDMFWQVILF